MIRPPLVLLGATVTDDDGLGYARSCGAMLRKGTPHPGALADSDPKRPRSGDGPPDLEELWQDLNRKIAGLFGGRRGTGPGRPPSVNIRLIAALALIAVAALWVLSGIFTVQQGDAAVVLQFGQVKYVAGPGMQWRLPYPIQSHEIVSLTRIRSVDVGATGTILQADAKDASMLTSDENIVDVRFQVQYRVKDPVDFLFNNATSATDTVRQIAQAAVRQIVGRTSLNDLLAEGREKIALELSGAIQARLDETKAGIVVTTVSLVSLQPPEKVQTAYNDAVSAAQDRERKRNDGRAYANDVLPRAQGDAARILLDAEGYRAKVVADAQGDADRFKQVYAEYSKAPAVTRERMYLDTMQKVLSNTTKVLVDTKVGSTVVLPVDKLLEASRAPAVVASPPAAQASSPAPAASPATGPSYSTGDEDMRSRDAARSRERETR